MKIESIALPDIIHDPNQPRKHFDPVPLVSLGNSMKGIGQVSPIRVRWDAALGKYVIINGNRRYLAAQAVGLTHLDAVVAEAAEMGTVRLEQVASNQSELLTDGELARAIKEIMDLDPNLTQAEACRLCGVDEAKGTRVMSYWAVDETVRRWVDERKITSVPLYYIGRLNGAAQVELAREVAEGRATTEDCKARVHALLGKQPRKPKSTKTVFELAGVTFKAESIDAVRKASNLLSRKLKKVATLEELAGRRKGEKE